MSLSERIRPGSEAAPWVCEEIKRMEALLAQMAAALEGANGFILDHGDKKAAVQSALTAYATMSPDPQWQRVPEGWAVIPKNLVRADVLAAAERARGEG